MCGNLKRKMAHYGYQRLVVLLPLLLLVSCAQLSIMPPKLVEPTVELISIKLGKLSFFEQKLIARLKVTNPNDLEVPVASLSCFVELENNMVASGLSTEPFVLPAMAEHEFEMLISTSAIKMSRSIARFVKARKESVEYRVSGKLKVDIPFVGPFSFEKDGKVEIKR